MDAAPHLCFYIPDIHQCNFISPGRSLNKERDRTQTLSGARQMFAVATVRLIRRARLARGKDAQGFD